jgi:hypothetical protein
MFWTDLVFLLDNGKVSPLSQSRPVAFRRYVFIRRNVGNDLLLVFVVMGRVANMFRRKKIFG